MTQKFNKTLFFQAFSKNQSVCTAISCRLWLFWMLSIFGNLCGCVAVTWTLNIFLQLSIGFPNFSANQRANTRTCNLSTRDYFDFTITDNLVFDLPSSET